MAASFNPPTLAHVRMAEIAHEKLRLGEVLLELSIANVDKGLADAPLSDRLMMMLALVRDRPWLSVGLGTHARFIDKAAAIRPHAAATEIVFVVGADTLIRVFDGKYYAQRDAELEELFSSCTFVCANREGSGWAEIDALLATPQNRRFANRVGRLELDPYHASLSSSAARAAVRSAAADTWPVPEEVAAYIRGSGLYRGERSG